MDGPHYIAVPCITVLNVQKLSLSMEIKSVSSYYTFQFCSLDSQDINGETALHVACTFNNHWMVNWLLKHQADPEIAWVIFAVFDELSCLAMPSAGYQYI